MTYRMAPLTAILALLAGAAVAADATPAAATNDAPASWLLDGVAAQVNNDTITIAEVMSEVRNSAWIELSRDEREARLRDYYTATLDALIDRRLILAAARDREVKLQGWVVDDRIREVVDSRFKGDRARLVEALTERHISYEDWRKGIEEEMIITAMRLENVDKRVSVSPGDVRAYYATNRADLSTSPGVRLAIITLVPGEKDGETVEQSGARVLAELDRGTDFAAVARQYSKDAKATAGGDWGWVNPEEKLAAPLVRALAALKPGEHSRVVMLADHGYIVRKYEEKPATVLTLQEAWPLIERRLRAQQSETLYREWAGRLRRNAYVRISELPGPSGRH